jgi:hypothetical protein
VSIPVSEQSARRQIGSRSLGHQRSLAAPPAALRNPSRTAGLLACNVSPTPPSQTFRKAQWRESVGTPLTVAGAATDRQKAYRVPFSPSGIIEGPCAGHVPASGGVVKWSADRFRRRRSQRTPPPTPRSFRPGRLQTTKKDRPGLRQADLRAVWAANHEVRTRFAVPTMP